MENDLDTQAIRNWRSILTLVVFILINLPILSPLSLPIFVPQQISKTAGHILHDLRIVNVAWQKDRSKPGQSRFIRYDLPINYVTAPIAAVLFLLAVTAIGRHEIELGIVGDDDTGICPYDLIIVYLSLGYIANSIGAAGLIRYVVYRTINYGKAGHRVYFYLYILFFGVGTFLGNDPIMVLFLSYFCRAASNIMHPRAWIYAQFAVANIATCILVSSNPTNLVLAGAFNIRFISFTANMIVPVVATTMLLFPYLLYIIFADEALVPFSIKVHEIPEESKVKKPVNMNISFARKRPDDDDDDGDSLRSEYHRYRLMELESILNPFLDKGSALVGSVILIITIVMLLALNAVYLSKGGNTDFWVTLPAAVALLCWDLAASWMHRAEVRNIARQRREFDELKRVERTSSSTGAIGTSERPAGFDSKRSTPMCGVCFEKALMTRSDEPISHCGLGRSVAINTGSVPFKGTSVNVKVNGVPMVLSREAIYDQNTTQEGQEQQQQQPSVGVQRVLTNLGLTGASHAGSRPQQSVDRATLFKSLQHLYAWCQETFTTATVSIRQLPYDLIPFAFSMFILVEALVSKGWIPVFAHGWGHWASKTGPVGCIAGMGFLGVILSSFAGTNIGACILLSRVIQAWQEIQMTNGTPVSERMFWGSVYSLSLGVNFGAFGISVSASLTGMMWRSVLAKEKIFVRALDFCRVNIPIITFAMVIACTVLIGETYLVRHDSPYKT